MRRNDPDFLASTVANTILGGGFTSRLIEELRVKRSLTYSAYSTFVGRKAPGDFRIGTFTKSPTSGETLALALTVLGDFRSRPSDPKVLAKGKSYLLGQFPLKVESPDALAGRLAEIEFFALPPDELATSGAARRVTPARTRASPRRTCRPGEVAIVWGHGRGSATAHARVRRARDDPAGECANMAASSLKLALSLP